MLFAAIYLVLAGFGFWFVGLAINGPANRTVGLAYIRSSLGWSFCLMAVAVLIRFIFGFWWMHPALAVVIGFVMAAGMMAIF